VKALWDKCTDGTTPNSCSPRRVRVLKTTFEGQKFMATSLNGKTIAFLVAPEGVEQVELGRSFFYAGKPVAVICHAPGR
jgi:hypothetical protein